MNAVQRAMHFREEPNDPVSPDFRPGLFVKRSPDAEGWVKTSRRAGCRYYAHTPAARMAASTPAGGARQEKMAWMAMFFV